jgi:hypothetical protein
VRAGGPSSHSCRTSSRFIDDRCSLISLVAADRLCQSRLLHLPFNVRDDFPRDLQPIFAVLLPLPLPKVNTDSAENLLSGAHNIVPTEGDHQAFAGPGPESGPIFVATNTSSNVAV